MVNQKSKLDKYLILHAYINKLFGKKNFEEIRELLKNTQEGFDEEGHSYIFKVLSGQQNIQIPIDKLEQYDNNIKQYLETINQKRETPFQLKYFQYLSILYTEIYLDLYFQNPIELANNLNEFTEEYIQKYLIAEKDTIKFFFNINDLKKLAYWMATGSGKSHLVTLNYLQFIKFNKGQHKINYENILLITPTETLSQQHLDELHLSSIPSQIFQDHSQGYFKTESAENIVKIIDIHKLTTEKKGKGVSVDISGFGSNNLVFVDEGHKGSGGITWRSLRKKIAEDGFTIEYSATFGEAIAATSKKEDLLHEYGKSILFDYSYPYFYKDGYGKDYRILNLKDKAFSSTTKDILLLANLLSYYEQKLVYDEYREKIKPYNLEEPLWIFVGSKVQGKQEQSDVLTVIIFLSKILTDQKWVIQSIDKILKGNSGLLDKQDRDLFSPSYPEQKLQYIREKNPSPQSIYTDILKRVFHIINPASLHLVNIKNASGEIGLKAGTGSFFGVINIGDDSKFLKRAEQEPTLHIESDEISRSLFENINNLDSEINVLIGAKKFIEGWNSWRVSNMGLLNIGKQEGSQIIQLFGRGVRLRGKNRSLKRSSFIEDNPPSYLTILETLNIFGIEANYMEQFRKHLETEHIETYTELSIKIKIKEDYLEKELLLPNINTSQFPKEQLFELDIDNTINPTINLTPKIDILTSLKKKGIQAIQQPQTRYIPKDHLDLLNWDTIHFELLKYKKQREWNNILIQKNTLKKILEQNIYTLYCPKQYLELHQFNDLVRLQDIAITILRKYLQFFYTKYKNQWIQTHMKLIKLTKNHSNLGFKEYTLKINEEEPLIIAEIKQILDNKLQQLYQEFQSNYLNNIYFDRHLYQPLLEDSSTIQISPAGLNEGEQKFIKDLKQYLKSNLELFNKNEIYILRNLPRKGIGFFKSYFFYPDFIIWIKQGEKQHLIFVDPKSLVHIWEGLDQEKIQLFSKIKKIEKQLQTNTQKPIYLDSFIISINSYNEIKNNFQNMSRQELEENHILFQTDDKENYIQKLLHVAI